MMARLFTDDPEIGIKEVGVELVRAGLARRQKGFDLKYGELAAAEKEAQGARRGLWAADLQ
jgi:endonuclease YncB( thermonuclease family)